MLLAIAPNHSCKRRAEQIRRESQDSSLRGVALGQTRTRANAADFVRRKPQTAPQLSQEQRDLARLCSGVCVNFIENEEPQCRMSKEHCILREKQQMLK